MELFFKYFALCWFRNDPLELVPHPSFKWKVIGFYLVSGMIVEGLIADVEGVIEVWLRIIMALSSISIFLLVNKKWHYFDQLVTAIFFCEGFILPLTAGADGGLYHYMVINHIPYYEAVTTALAVVFVVWYLGIVAYILRKMFDMEMLNSWVYAFGYFVMTYGIPMMTMDM